MRRKKPVEKLRIIREHLDGETSVAEISRSSRIPLRTLYRWVSECRKNDGKCLGMKKRSDKNSHRKFPENLIRFIEGLAFQSPKKSVARIHSDVSEYASKKGFSQPSYSTIKRVINKLPQGALDLEHKGRKFYENNHELLYRREANQPNHIWQADHTELDIYVLDDKGQQRRPWLTIIIDDYSRAIAGYYLYFEHPTALQTALTLRESIWYKTDSKWVICGIPDILYTDHGTDFTSEHIEIVCAQLKIKPIFSAPGKPRGRGRVERFFSTVNQKFLSNLPGYINKKKHHEHLLTLKQLDEKMHDFLVNQYHYTTHSTTKVTPLSRWNQKNFIPRMPESLEQLNLLLLCVVKERLVQRDGIRFQGFRYVSPILAAYVKEPVIIRYNPKDLAEIWVYHQDVFICKAVCQELQSDCISLKEVIAARKKRKKELKNLISQRKSIVDSLLGTIREEEITLDQQDYQPKPRASKIKLYENDE